MIQEPADPSREAERSGLIERVRELFSSQSLAVLATCGEGQPHGSLVAFAGTADLKQVLFATPRATRKYAHLDANPAVALVIDSRSREDADFHLTIAVTAIGRAAEATGDERGELLPVYLARHPHLREFATSPTCALVKVQVRKYSVVGEFQKVVEIDVDGLG